MRRKPIEIPYIVGDESIERKAAVAELVKRLLDVAPIVPAPPAGQEPKGPHRRDRCGAGQRSDSRDAFCERGRGAEVQVRAVAFDSPVNQTDTASACCDGNG